MQNISYLMLVWESFFFYWFIELKNKNVCCSSRVFDKLQIIKK